MLLAANKWDPATEHSYRWAKELADAVHFDKILNPEEITRKNAEAYIPNHDIVVFYDHGSETALISQGGNENFLDLNNVDLVAGKTVYTMCCLAAKSLGVEAYKRGAVWWGYTESYGFITTEDDVFREQANYGLVIKIVEGVTWEEAYRRSQEKDVELIEKAEDIWAKVWLQRNSDCKVLYSEDSPPKETACRFRRLALRLFGLKRGWKL